MQLVKMRAHALVHAASVAQRSLAGERLVAVGESVGRAAPAARMGKRRDKENNLILLGLEELLCRACGKRLYGAARERRDKALK